MNKVKSVQNLSGDFLKSIKSEVFDFFLLSIILIKLVKIVFKKFCDNEKVFLMIKEINHSDNIFLITIFTVCLDVP